MAKVSTRKWSGRTVHVFWCEGCKNHHSINDGWSFNGDHNNPTFSPSILVRGTQRMTDDEYDRIIAGEHIEPRPFVCHSFVTDGKIQYLSDCTHELAGQTVELKDYWKNQKGNK